MLLGAAAARCTDYRSHTLRAVRFLRSAQAVAMPVSMQFNAGSIHASPGGQPPLSSAAARHTLLHNRFRAEDEGHPANGGGARGRDCASRIWATTGVRWRLQTSIDVGDGGWMMLGGHSQIRGMAARRARTRTDWPLLPHTQVLVPSLCSHVPSDCPLLRAAKRAALDEARMKARSAKAGLNPGPGAYDVKRPAVTAAEVRARTPQRPGLSSRGHSLATRIPR